MTLRLVYASAAILAMGLSAQAQESKTLVGQEAMGGLDHGCARRSPQAHAGRSSPSL